MAVRMVGVNSDAPRLPQGVITASQGNTATDLAPGDTLVTAKDYTDTAVIALGDEAAATFLAKTGGTMTGPLILPTPTAANHAATKEYVDAVGGGGGGGGGGGITEEQADLRYLQLAGGDLTGAISAPVGSFTTVTLGADPVDPNDAATKAYVDAVGGGGGGGGLPTGGTTGQALTKTSATDFDAGWTTVLDQTAGDARYLKLAGGTVTGNLTLSNSLTINSDQYLFGDLFMDGGGAWGQVIQPRAPTSGNHLTNKTYVDTAFNSYSGFSTQAGTTYTIALSDIGKLTMTTAATAVTVTVPPNSSVAFPIGTRLDFVQMSSGGRITFAQGAGVTVQPTSATTRALYSGATLVKRATDHWLVFGDLG